jgi:hypothetical protein
VSRFILAAVVRRASLAAYERMMAAAESAVGLVSSWAWGLAGHVSGCGCQDDDAVMCTIGDGSGTGSGVCKCECHKAIKAWDES